MEYEVEPSGEAQALLDSPLLNGIFDALESDAIERAMTSKDDDHDTRLFAKKEVEAIRSVREQLTERASGKAKHTRIGSAA